MTRSSACTHVARSLCLSISLLAAGCGGAAVSSERQVLPSFHAQELQHTRLLLAPYALKALDPERAVPLEDEDMEDLAKQYSDKDPNRAALKAFYASSATRAQSVLAEQSIGAGLVQVEPARWGSYFENSARFIDVTLDGKLRYQVPERSLLAELGSDADFVIVLGSMAYQTTHTTTTNNAGTFRSHSADFEGRFLVWDYRKARALAEGKLECSVNIKRDATLDSLKDLGRLVIEEILAKRPFHG